jgi:DNA (cytosine-5)-methyltransferase 1
MKIGSLFSGIGGLELGLEAAGLGETVWQVERDPFCLRVLAKRWPLATRFNDVRSVGASNLTPVDLICGGFPCQDISGAGKGAGLAGDRSGLWSEFARIVGECAPWWVVVENVSSGAVKWVDPVVSELGRLGYESLPVPLSGEDVGAPHRRERIFIVARRLVSDTRREQLRLERQRESGGRPHRVRPQGDEVPPADGPGRGVDRWEADTPWAFEPGVGRVADGVPSRAHRLRALGNSVVPQCAEVIGWIVRTLHEERP